MPPIPIDEQEIDDKFAWSLRNLIDVTEPFASWLEGRVWVINPTIATEWINTPCVSVQAVPERDLMNRLVGQYAENQVHGLVTLYIPADSGVLDYPEVTAAGLLRKMEKVIHTGHAPEEGDGLLFDLENLGDPNPKKRFLNEYQPKTQRLGVSPIIQEGGEGELDTLVAFGLEIVAIYEAIIDPETGLRVGE